MAGPRRKRVGAVILWVLAFAFLAIDQTDRLQRVVGLVPDRYSRYLPLVYAALGVLALLLLHSAHQDEIEEARAPDVTSLHEANAALQARINALEAARSARHLDQRQTDAIVRVIGTGTAAIRTACLDAGLTPEDFASATPLSVAVVAIGGEPETLSYRNDFAQAFGAAGVEVIQEAWEAGHKEYDAFVGNISVLEGNPANVFRPYVLAALREAGLAPREAPFPPIHSIGRNQYSQASAWLVIGQRV
jgi:hypothetical protein